jgi:hypothetical protein
MRGNAMNLKQLNDKFDKIVSEFNESQEIFGYRCCNKNIESIGFRKINGKLHMWWYNGDFYRGHYPISRHEERSLYDVFFTPLEAYILYFKQLK